ncbi:hypothetical protein QKC54_gp0027 [Megavirus baoshan]|uniref:Phage protein n=1 Tax=Megavirus baoshan TaxID=2496520 RepID=A0A8K1T1C7_9VIRU|nr:hypothetical protein QKC54_gp1054 [Megavirus baoshan]YP_010789304.1 hypothetical protein QKC54_gp0027 [Megavirus baoshan]UFX99709.1 hypothetical protein Mb0018 [Megavirus baoshan]UFX99929.1 hypothetical protein Mb1045 [Megavirus baoshan]
MSLVKKLTSAQKKIFDQFENTTQEQLNAMSPSEYQLWAGKYREFHEQHFPNSCICLPRQRSAEEILQRKIENRDFHKSHFQRAVEMALHNALASDSCFTIEDFKKKFNTRLNENL